jgi:hypothetical protein
MSHIKTTSAFSHSSKGGEYYTLLHKKSSKKAARTPIFEQLSIVRPRVIPVTLSNYDVNLMY